MCVLLLLAACDTRAKASDPLSGHAESKSKELESCSASMQCRDELRCFDNVCRRTNRSTVGDYYAALGSQLRGRGELEQAVEAYSKAVGHYGSEKIDVPADVDCAYGAALAAAKGKKEHAELGARVLHRCLLAVPVGSSLRDRALADLATLADAGLDPLAIGRTQLADVYLTRGAQKPSSDKVAVSLSTNPNVDSKKTYSLIPERLAQADVKSALVACWEAYNTTTKKDALAVTVSLKSSYQPSEYEDEPGRFSFKVEPGAAMAPGPEANADQCVRAAVEPALKGLSGIRDAFATKLTITIK